MRFCTRKRIHKTLTLKLALVQPRCLITKEVTLCGCLVVSMIVRRLSPRLWRLPGQPAGALTWGATGDVSVECVVFSVVVTVRSIN